MRATLSRQGYQLWSVLKFEQRTTGKMLDFEFMLLISQK